jgi:Transglutaminase-like superfamily
MTKRATTKGMLCRALGRALVVTGSCLLLASTAAYAQVVSESPEIVYTGTDAQLLRDKASQLGSAVGIYEYVHNTIEYSHYHGSRSGSINTFLGQRGSDVDIATALIAMLRSQNIPARYAVGTVRIPAAQLTNWLGIPQLDTAVEVLKSQGIQGVTLSTDRSTVDFEHAWAEAFVPFDQYRGINTVSPAVDCSRSANVSRCTWVALDASFKQKNYNGLNLDPYNAITFDYTAYYNAIKNNDAARRDKNPLSILDDQIGDWLRTNYAGKTLEDVEDAGQIIPLREGLLPASLPYQVVGSVRRYDTITLHDAVVPATESKAWAKRLSITYFLKGLPGNGGGVSLSIGSYRLAELLNTRRLTLTTEILPPTNVPSMVLRLGGTEVARPVQAGAVIIGGSRPYAVGDAFDLVLSMDGAPGVGGAADRSISATYTGIIGGYYLIATGCEYSNWTQVHRAADQLLTSNDQYKIVFKPGEAGCLADGTNCTPYVDANGNGWDTSDTKLLENKPALDALSGGLLYVGAMQYYAKLRDQFERADRLMKTRTPVIGFLGVVSSVYEAEYIDGTAFSILPGGLLIDMKGITIGGSYRTNESAVSYSNRQFEFLGHITSSLEHETWQELTGYDAVSTVRGIQMALANGASLLNPKKNATTDTLPGLYPSLGFATTVPTGFTYAPYSVFSTMPATWSHATSGASFDTFLSTVSTSTSATQQLVGTYSYFPTGGLYGWSKCVANQVTAINSHPATSTLTGSTCDGTAFSGTPSNVLSVISSDWSNTIIPYYIGSTSFNYFDRSKGFTTTGRVFRALPAPVDAHDTLTIASIRNDLYLRNTAQSWVEYLIPSKLTVGSTYRFAVDVRKSYDTVKGQLTSISMEIANRSTIAGGGYVGLDNTTVAAPSDNAVKTHKTKQGK